MKTPPDVPQPAVLECIVMPNGDVICRGATLGRFNGLAAFLFAVDEQLDRDLQASRNRQEKARRT